MLQVFPTVALWLRDTQRRVLRTGGFSPHGRSTRRQRLVSRGAEPLEPRMVLSGGPLITEFMAINDGSLLDEDSDASDWIEVHNPTASTINLDGWYLTDDASHLDRWQFPNVSIPADGYLIVFASTKDRAVAGNELHTNFELEAGGEYLALVENDATTIAHDFASQFPAQTTAGVSYGLSFGDAPLVMNAVEDGWIRSADTFVRDDDYISVWSSDFETRYGLLEFDVSSLREEGSTLEAVGDTWVRESNGSGTFNDDGISVWNSNSTDGSRRWGILEFDVSGQTISSLDLNLWSQAFGFGDDVFPLKQSAAIIDISSTGKTTENLTWNDVSGLAQTSLETLGTFDIPAPNVDLDAPEYKTSSASANDIAAVQAIADGSGQLVLLLQADEPGGSTNYSGTWGDGEASVGGGNPQLIVNSGLAGVKDLASVSLELFMPITGSSSDNEPAKQTAFIFDRGATDLLDLDWAFYQANIAGSETALETLGAYDVGATASTPSIQNEFLASVASEADLNLIETAAASPSGLLTLVFKADEVGPGKKADWGDSEGTGGSAGPRLTFTFPSTGADPSTKLYFQSPTPGAANGVGVNISPAASYAAIPQPDSQVAGLWLLDETEGPVGEENWGVNDQSGHGNVGTRSPLGTLSQRPSYSTDTPNPASWNYSLDFSTSNNALVEMVDTDSLDLTGDFTVETWVNFNSLSGTQYLVSKRNSSGASSGYFLEWAAGTHFAFTVGTSSGYQAVSSTGIALSTGEWHHVAAVHDATAGQLRLYVDGVLNNTASVQSTVLTNDDPLTLGQRDGGLNPANAKLDEVRVSSRIVPPSELGFSNVFGPPQIILGDNFESYTSRTDLFTRSGGERNHWRDIEETASVDVNLLTTNAHSGSQAGILRHVNAPPGDHEGQFYYNLPVGHTRDEPVIAQSGWVSFSGEENVRLFIDHQVWTGVETHYGVTQTLLIGGMTYFGDTKTWSVDPGNPIDYSGDLDTWHYYSLDIDYDKKEYVSFQFDNNKWDMTGQAISVLPGFFNPGLLPTVDHTIRLLELPSLPAQPWTANFAQDDAAFTIVPQAPPSGATLPYHEDFDDDVADNITEVVGNWHEFNGRYEAAAADTSSDAIALVDLLDPLPSDVRIDVLVQGQAPPVGFFQNGVVVFDYQSPTNFKFAGGFFGANQWRIGHVTGGTWIADVAINETIDIETDYKLSVRLSGDEATLLVDGVPKVSFDYANPLNDGQIGLATHTALAEFDNLSITLPGDMNGDGLVNLGDVAPMIQALTDPTGYAAAYPLVNVNTGGDLDNNGTLDTGDLGVFSTLFGGPARASATASATGSASAAASESMAASTLATVDTAFSPQRPVSASPATIGQYSAEGIATTDALLVAGDQHDLLLTRHEPRISTHLGLQRPMDIVDDVADLLSNGDSPSNTDAEWDEALLGLLSETLE